MPKVLAKAKGKMQMQGPYRSKKSLYRLMNLEGIFLILQFIGFLTLAAITGIEWLLDGQYLKFTLIFGGSAISIFLMRLTRSPIFIVTTFAISLAGALWH